MAKRARTEEASVLLIRRPGSPWREPETTSYANEKELQDLVKASATLLPDTAPSAVVDEFWIPEAGSVDLLVVDRSGALTLVECKLRANPEIRREVVGQILAYAGGLSHMSYDEFAAGFRSRAGQALDTAVAQATGEEVDADQLREAITQRLGAGEFRLIIAVDQITPELKLVVEYLNRHTVDAVQVLALELNYTKDGDIELLVPTVYGQETAVGKARTTAWTAETFLEQVQEQTTGEVRAFIDRLLANGRQRGHHPFYGSGANPSVAYYYALGGRPVSVWALYLRPTGPVLNLSFGALSNRSFDQALAFLNDLKAEPTLGAALADIDETTLHKYPPVPIDGLLTTPAVQEAFFAALDRLTMTSGANRP
jgi:hypothetical protein